MYYAPCRIIFFLDDVSPLVNLILKLFLEVFIIEKKSEEKLKL